MIAQVFYLDDGAFADHIIFLSNEADRGIRRLRTAQQRHQERKKQQLSHRVELEEAKVVTSREKSKRDTVLDVRC